MMLTVKKITAAGSFALACLGACAQMPVPLLDGQADKGGAGQIDPYAQAVKQLETLLTCKPGAKFDARDVQARFEALGLRKGQDGLFWPPANTPRVALFGGEVLAAMADDAAGEKKVTVYLRQQTGKQIARKLGVNKIDEYATTDELSYVKETSKKTTLMVGAASELFVGNSAEGTKYSAMVACQLRK